MYAAGLRANLEFAGTRVAGNEQPDDPAELALYDPQTSGGLLIAVPSEKHAWLLAELEAAGVTAWTVGTTLPGDAGSIELV